MHRFQHIAPDELLLDSFRLGKLVYESGFRPKHAISIWRGGTPVGLGVDAYFRLQGTFIHHTTITTSSYTGVREQGDVVVKGLEHLVRSVCREDGLLIIDDVYESGNTIKTIVATLRERARQNAPEEIRIATVHRKPSRSRYDELPVHHLYDVDGDVWLDYPHELADLMIDGDPDQRLIRQKSPEIHAILRGEEPPIPSAPADAEGVEEGYVYVTARELLHDAFRLGVRIAETGYRPDFLVALWPGGVFAGLALHEVFKYWDRLDRSGGDGGRPDHIALNTTRTHLTYRTQILGLDYLLERVARHHQILIVDTGFQSGRMASDVVNTLKEGLRRNLDLRKVRIAAVYWKRDDSSTWTVRPFRTVPDFYLKAMSRYVILPHAVYRFRAPRRELGRDNPDLAALLFPRDET